MKIMNSLSNKPHQLLWWLIPVVLLLGWLFRAYHFDIQMHDTYFVLRYIDLGLVLSLLLAFLGFVYWLVKNRDLINWLTFLHLVGTIGLVIYFVYSVVNVSFGFEVGSLYKLDSIFIFFITQVPLVLNLMISFFSKK